MHNDFMQECFKLALKGKGDVSPNPLVGSVIVKNNKIISRGYHKRAGDAHAELDAINNATEDISGSTLYCNLEPCCHTSKRTPPCAQRIVQEGIKEVIICNLDPNPEVSGMGIKILEDAGIKVTHGILEAEGLKLNEIFFKHIISKTPFIHLKMAQTIDGRLATINGDSKWITNEEARLDVHIERESYDAILVGDGTLKQDNPNLTVRIPSKKVKAIKRIVMSKELDLNPDSKLFTDEFKDKTILVIPKGLKCNINTTIIECPIIDDAFDMDYLLKNLYSKHAITSVYVEGGSYTLTELLKKKLFDRISIYIAPKILGNGKSTIGELDIGNMKDTIEFNNIEYKTFDENIKFTALRKK
jgi:diaminohydroxyphosphoribosylaminopyrimidine deaminase/5-amino-6-(5-phosphoribosylamino)uracil reductase